LSDRLVNEVIKVSRGDMRKCINILQSLYLAVSWDASSESRHILNGNVGSPIIEEGIGANNLKKSGRDLTLDDFYRIVGTISPSKVEQIFAILMKYNFSEGSSSKIIRDQSHNAGKRCERRRHN